MASAHDDKNEILALVKSLNALPETQCSDVLTGWLRRSQNSCAAKLEHPRLSLFLASHGFATSPTAPKNKNDTVEFHTTYMKKIADGQALLNKLCLAGDADLRVYDMDLNNPNHDCLSMPAQNSFDDESFVRALAYGMMAVEPGLDMMAVCATGSGSDTSSRAVYHLHRAHTQSILHDIMVEKLIHAAQRTRGFDCIQKIGGFELAALCGVIIAARLANCPVLVSGYDGAAALWCLYHENPHAIEHCAFLQDEKNIISVPDSCFNLNSLFSTPHETGTFIAAHLPHYRTHILLESYRHAPNLASAA